MLDRKFFTVIALGWGVTQTFAAEKPVSYYEDIRPIFQAHCQGCHQPAKDKGGYVMTDFANLLAGGDSEKTAVVPKDAAKSHLLALITPNAKGEAEMPKDKAPLTKPEIELVQRWIAAGAIDDTPANAKAKYDVDNPPTYTLPPVITSMDYSPDGQLLAVAGFHEVLLHKADGSGLVARLIGMSERIESVRFSPDGKLLAVTGGKPARMGEVQIWNVAKQTLELSHPTTFDTVYGACWSPDGQHLAFGCADNTVRAIEVKTGRQVFFQGAHNDWVFDTAYDVKGEHLISVGRDMTAKLTVFKTSRFIDNITSITPKALKGGLAAIARHPKRNQILVGGSDSAPQVFRIFRQTARKIGDNANLIRKFPEMPGRVFSVRYSADGSVFAAGSGLDGKGQVVIFREVLPEKIPDDIQKLIAKDTLNSGETIKLDKFYLDHVKDVAKVDIGDSGIYAIAVSPDGKMVAAAGSDGKIRLFNSTDGKATSAFVPVKLEGEGVAVSTVKEPQTEAAVPAKETLPKGATVKALTIEPTELVLNSPIAYAQVLVSAKLSTGDTVDVTRQAKLELSGPAAITAHGIATPLKNGTGTLTVSLGGKSATAPVKISGLGAAHKVDYIRDVTPVLSKAGCNAGTCHGAKDGKNGFKLSLRGYDPIYDVRAFTDELASRRVNVASADDSMMLLKATAGAPHTGGQIIVPGGKYYRIIHNWIANGAKLDLTTPKVKSISLSPMNPVVQQIGSRQQFRVVATYADGTKRDVTAESVIESGNTDIASHDPRGLLTTLRRGEAPVLARYEGAYAATTLTAMGDRTGFVWKQPDTWTKVDRFVADKWKRMKILPSDLCTDAEFIRRVYLDLTGLPPSAEEVKKFLSDNTETRAKRNALIDKLIGSEEYIDHWSNKWADLLMVNRKFLGTEGSKMFRGWIRNEIKQNTPYNEFASKVLTATGSNKANPPASYYKILRKPDETMENTTHLWLATRFNCNKCHDHPFERWTQDQYYEMTAFFAQVGLKRDPASGKATVGGTAVEGKKPLYEEVYDRKDGETTHQRTGAITPPAFPYTAKFEAKGDATRRQRLAAWITSPDNRYFARSYVNRIWGYLLGVGIIEPLDDIRAGNPPTNPELLDWLTADFIAHNFDVRHLIRTITQSRTYQLSVKTHQWNGDDDVNYSHAVPRRLPAEVLFDAIYFATGTQSKFPGVPAGTRAAALPDAGVKLADGFLGNLGRPPRESACECERSGDLQLGPVMALITGPTVDNAISDKNNAITKLVREQKDDQQLINELFLRILNRPATEKEIASCLKMLASIEPEHKALLGEREKLLATLKADIDAREKVRQDGINAAQKAMEDYRKNIAAREEQRKRKREADIKAAEAALKKNAENEPERFVDWLKSGGVDFKWTFVDAKELKSKIGTTLKKEDDNTIFASGKNGKDTFTVTTETTLKNLTGIRLEALTDDRLPKKGPGRAPGDGNFVLTELELYWAPANKPNERKKLKLEAAKADFSQGGYAVGTAIDGSLAGSNNGWAVAPQLGKPHVASFEVKDAPQHDGPILLTFVMKQEFSGNNWQLGKFRWSITNGPKPLKLNPGLPKNITDLLAKGPEQRRPNDIKVLRKYFNDNDASTKALKTALANAKKPLAADPKLKELQDAVTRASRPLPLDPRLMVLNRAVDLSTKQLTDKRLYGAQDIAWALINNPAFLFNH